MRYRELGNTGLKVSEIGFGGEWLGELSQDEVTAVARACADAGVNILDCWMADPEIRTKLGVALEGMQDRWLIQGHVGSTWQDGQYVCSREMPKVRESFDDLLVRLGVDHVDLGMIHYVDDEDEFKAIMAGEFYEYVDELLRAGKIKHVGISTHNTRVAQLAAEDGRIELIMFSVNPAFDMLPPIDDVELLSRDESFDGEMNNIDPEREKLYVTCEQNGVAITVMKGYAGGRLLDAEKSPFGVALTVPQCLHYCLTRPAAVSVLVGLKSVAQLQDALAYEGCTAEELDFASVLANAPKHAYFNQCIYCGHCQPCSSGINIAVVNKFADLAKMQDEVPASVRDHYWQLDATAEDCTGCQACEPNCPFGVSIAERMRETAELFA